MFPARTFLLHCLHFVQSCFIHRNNIIETCSSFNLPRMVPKNSCSIKVKPPAPNKCCILNLVHLGTADELSGTNQEAAPSGLRHQPRRTLNREREPVKLSIPSNQHPFSSGCQLQLMGKSSHFPERSSKLGQAMRWCVGVLRRHYELRGSLTCVFEGAVRTVGKRLMPEAGGDEGPVSDAKNVFTWLG